MAAKRLKLAIPNIPDVFVDEIDDSEWGWIKDNYPAEYKQAQKEIKEHEEAQAAEEGVGDKQAEPAKAEPAKSGAKPAGKEG